MGVCADVRGEARDVVEDLSAAVSRIAHWFSAASRSASSGGRVLSSSRQLFTSLLHGHARPEEKPESVSGVRS
jgi:hypothetical protein